MNKIIHGNCLEVLPTLDDNSIDAIVTDPPYELGFMNKGWDASGIAYNVELWRECLRVLKPGGHLLSFGGSRTYHRMACAIEDAGFEIRDQIQWIYGSGFPKSQNIGKAIDKAAGVEREVVGETRAGIRDGRAFESIPEKMKHINITKGDSEWEGWGSALKPAQEIITLAMKPLTLQQERDIIVTNLLEKELLLCLMLPAKIVETSLGLNRNELDKVLNSAQWLADEKSNTQEGLSDLTDMSRLEVAMSMSLNTVKLWQNTLDDLSKTVSRCTTEMKTGLTTELRTLNYYLSRSTLQDIIREKYLNDGQIANVLFVENLFNAARLKLNAIQEHFAPANATLGVHTLHQAETDNEPIVLARKPLSEKTIAANVLKWGTGGINIDGCRVGTEVTTTRVSGGKGFGSNFRDDNWQPPEHSYNIENKGRFPANLIHDGSDEVVKGFPQSVGSKIGTKYTTPRYTGNAYANGKVGGGQKEFGFGDSGSAARFFYAAKASKSERNMGLTDNEEVTVNDGRQKDIDNPFQRGITPRKNSHPTVKPLALMRYLCRLITPPDGTVLDPFAGSGSTLIAAKQEGFDFIGIEMEAEYIEIIKARLSASQDRQQTIFGG